MDSMLGCGGEASPAQVSAIKATLMPMWRTLPKTSDRIDRRSLRYIVHRYFMQTSSLMVRGFEPSRPTNDSSWGSADILSQMVPAYVEKVLESRHKTENGFTLQDVTDMVLMMDQLIFDSESTVLEGVYKMQKKPMHKSLSYQGMKQVMEAYLVNWMIEAEPRDIAMLLRNRTLLSEALPHYHELMKFTDGRIKGFEHARQQQQGGSWSMRFSFDDAHTIAGGLTRSFQSYWESECTSMKDALVSMDSHSTGRIPLAKFYNTAINSDWRFGESEAYLRELGALDETSTWQGPQVIIPNYIQATSNCIVSTSHYLVCCTNECESLMGEIEVAIDAPTALPSTIVNVVSGMSSMTSLDEDEPPHLSKALLNQLDQIAKTHGGMVPLHGRLFAQWLHYVFPRECPFPHKTGATTSATPVEFGDDYVASKDDMEKHASTASTVSIPESVGKEELQWMSQFSPDEELMVDYASELSGSWFKTMVIVVGLLVAVGGLYQGVLSTSSGKKGNDMTSFSHSHYV